MSVVKKPIFSLVTADSIKEAVKRQRLQHIRYQKVIVKALIFAILRTMTDCIAKVIAPIIAMATPKI